MYALVFDKKAIDFLEKLDKFLQRRIWKKLVSAKQDPYSFFEKLSGRNDFKLRIGNYRIIADINKRKKLIQVTLIGHRKNVYEKLG